MKTSCSKIYVHVERRRNKFSFIHCGCGRYESSPMVGKKPEHAFCRGLIRLLDELPADALVSIYTNETTVLDQVTGWAKRTDEDLERFVRVIRTSLAEHPGVKILFIPLKELQSHVDRQYILADEKAAKAADNDGDAT